MTLKLTCKRYVYIRLSFRERLSFFSTLASWKSLLCSANINFTGVKSIQSFSASFRSPCLSVAGGATASQTLSQVRRPTLEERPENRACSNKHVNRTGGRHGGTPRVHPPPRSEPSASSEARVQCGRAGFRRPFRPASVVLMPGGWRPFKFAVQRENPEEEHGNGNRPDHLGPVTASLMCISRAVFSFCLFPGI